MASFENFKLQLRPHLYGQQFPGTKMQLPNAFTWGAPLAWPMRFEKWFNGAIALHLFADFGFISHKTEALQTSVASKHSQKNV